MHSIQHTTNPKNMKREGRQHGMVRTYPILPVPYNPRPKPKTVNEINSPPTAGLFNKVSSKPTNHSKFTGKCGRPMCRGCHIHPASKSKDKAKGAHKVRSLSLDVGSDHRVDARPGLKMAGFSASGILDYLASDDYVDSDYDNDDDYSSDAVGIEEVEEFDYGANDDDNNDDDLSFCEVGFVWESVDGDDSWCLVEEM